MSNGSGSGDRSSGGQGMGEDAAARANQLRAQAAVAWDRVQKVARSRPPRGLTVAKAVERAEQVPPEAYLAVAAGSLLTSAGLQAAERRASSSFFAFWGFLAFSLAFFFRKPQRRRR